ncbi:Uncharacterised protein [Corynebacterium renale]|uniref:hypothetical protein n=1 Tax=Corynebacterium renale TaxID=1724 RepID=UPI000DA37326|nr:hypothetical protein [Corynebacterium renale]SQG63571.1 Uncharacterised protein [Corynebacterium renale]STD00970.1 Uncharacterised protein [Corynebacterium renale]
MTASTPYVIFLGAGAIADEVRATLTNYASINATVPFAWADLSTVDPDFTVRLISPSDRDPVETVSLDDLLRKVSLSLGHSGVLMMVLDPLGDPEVPGSDALNEENLLAWTEAIDRRLTNTPPKRARLLLPRQPLSNVKPVRLMAYSNFALAAEDSDTPLSSVAPIMASDDPTAVARVAAPSLLSMCGLWKQSTTCLLYDDQGNLITTGSETDFRLVRTYHRAVDAMEVEEELLLNACDVSGALPLPRTADNKQTVVLPNPDHTTEDISRKILEKNEASLLTPLVHEKSPETTQTDAMAALKAFLSEFFRAVIGKPSDWRASVSSSFNQRMAESVQNLLYGTNSGVEVTFGGESGDANASLDARSEHAQHALDQIRQVHASANEKYTVEPPNALSDLWGDYRDMAHTLVDGTERIENMRPQDNQFNPAIVPQGWLSVPDATKSFNGAHPALEDAVGLSAEDAVILPFDSVGANAYSRDLDFVAGRNPSVQQLRQDFRTWREEQSRSFAWRFGEKLNGYWERATKNQEYAQRRYQEITQELQSFEGRDYAAENKRLSRTLRIFSLIWLLVILVLSYSWAAHTKPEIKLFDAQPTIDWRWWLLSVVLTTVVVLLIQMLVFANARKGIEQARKRLQVLTENQRIMWNNYVSASRDAVQLSNAYHQFLAWSTLLGRAIAFPLGKPASRDLTRIIADEGLPRNTQMGKAVLEESSRERVIGVLRSAIYGRDWARETFDTMLEDVEQVLMDSGTNVVINANDLLGQQGLGSRSALDRAATVARGEALDDFDSSISYWMEALRNPDAEALLRNNLNNVEVAGKTIPRTEFFDSLVNVDVAAGRFSTGSLSAVGAGSDATTVDPRVSRLAENTGSDTKVVTLSESVTFVQFGMFTQLDYLIGDTSTDTSSIFEVPNFDAPATSTLSFEAPGPHFDNGDSGSLL